MRRALVSGITGHLGHEVARQLSQQGIAVFGLTRQLVAHDHALGNSARLLQIDGSTASILSAFEQASPDVVIHLAGLSRREHRSSDIEPFVAANILLGVQLLEGMRIAGCRRMITAGTYLQHYETDAFRAFNLYAATRQAFEALLEFYVDAYEIAAVRLTLADIYSEHDTRPKLMTDIAKSWHESVPLNLRDPDAFVDLIHVEDAAAAFLHAASLLENGGIPDRALSRYSVSSGEDITALELVHRFERRAGRNLSITRDSAPAPSRRIKPRRGEPVPGWKPRITLEDGIDRILAGRPARLANDRQASINP
jgi:nucleoside-diphosphate-sugar epimerase